MANYISGTAAVTCGDAESQKLVAGGNARLRAIVKDRRGVPIASDVGTVPLLFQE